MDSSDITTDFLDYSWTFNRDSIIMLLQQDIIIVAKATGEAQEVENRVIWLFFNKFIVHAFDFVVMQTGGE